jgi:hypothetical protein
MTLRLFALTCVLLLSGSAFARTTAQGDPASLAERADAHAAQVADAKAFLAEVDANLELARQGQYGRLGRGAMQRLQSARDRMHALLEGQATAMELAPRDRIALYNAQETMRGVLRDDDADRIVCRRETATGSRIATTECLTVAERRERARVAREEIERYGRNRCFTSSSGESAEAHDCAK